MSQLMEDNFYPEEASFPTGMKGDTQGAHPPPNNVGPNPLAFGLDRLNVVPHTLMKLGAEVRRLTSFGIDVTVGTNGAGGGFGSR
jgi:hypothetical protein